MPADTLQSPPDHPPDQSPPDQLPGANGGKPRRPIPAPVRWPLRLFAALLAIALFFCVTLLWAHRYRNGQYVARLVMELANPSFKGRLEFGSIRWGADTLIHLAVGLPAPARVEHLAVYDPAGERVIYAPAATAAIDVMALISGGHVLLYDIKGKGGYVNVRAVNAPDQPLEVGFLNAFSAPTPAPESEPGTIVELNGVDLENFRFKITFPSWSAEVSNLSIKGRLKVPEGDTAVEGVLYDAKATAGAGTLTIAGQTIPVTRVSLTRCEVTSADPMSWWVDATMLAAGAPVRAKGRMTNTFRQGTGVELAVSSKEASPLLKHLLGPRVSGEVQVIGRLDGPLDGPLISGKVRGVKADLGPAGLAQKLEGALALDLGAGTFTAKDVKGQALGGDLLGGGSLELASGDWKGTLDVSGMDPGVLDASLAGKLKGKVQLKGVTEPSMRALAVLDLDLARKQRDWLPRQVSIDGTVHLGTRVLDLAGVRLRGDGHTLEARGSVNISSGRVNLFTNLASPRLHSWLARKELIALARGATANLHVTGKIPDLRAKGTLRATGVGYDPFRLKRLVSDVTFDGEDLKLVRIRSEGYGGVLRGETSISLFKGDLRHPLKTPLMRGKVRAEGLDLTAMDSAAGLIGRLFGEAEVSGPLDKLTGTATFRLPRVTYQGEPYDGSWARLGILQDRLSIYRSSFQRQGGGKLEAWGDIYYDTRLDLRLRATAFPITGVPQLARLDLGLGGLVGGQVNVQGTMDNPRLSGKVALNDARLRNMAMGSGSIELQAGSDLVRINGDLLAGLLQLEGYMVTDPVTRVHLRVEVKRLPLEKLVYEVRKLGDVRGLVSGTIRLDMDSAGGLTWADARLPQVEVSLRHLAPGERRATVVKLENSEDLLARWDGSQLHVVTANLATRVEGQKGKQGKFTVGGWVSPAGADMQLRGEVALEILEFFLAGSVQSLSGEALANVKVKGPLDNLDLKGELDLRNINIQMPRFQRRILVPTGLIKLDGGGLKLDSLKIQVGQEVLSATGTLALAQFKPTTADLLLVGDVNMELLQLFFPQHISHAVGATWIKVRAQGPVSDPQLSGRLKVKRMEVSPRGWGRTITLESGEIDFSNYLIQTKVPLAGTYDEGMIRISGEVRLDRFEPVDVYLHIAGIGIPLRQPDVYSAEFNMDVKLLGDSHQLQLGGDLELVDLAYTRKFDVFKTAFIRPRVLEEDPPFWKGYPLLESLALNLKVRSMGQILVKNNLANLSLSGDFAVVGTLNDPRLGGLIRAEEGTFKLPASREPFSVSNGQIIFSRSKPMEQGTLGLRGEATIEGSNQVDYLITLAVDGPLSNPSIALSSVPNLDPGQITALLFLGRTTDQLRKELGGGAEYGASSGGSQAAGAADAQVKQLTGEILSSIIEDPLKEVTRLDVISLEVGTESAQIRAGKKLGRFILMTGEYELGLLGDTRAMGQLEVKMHDLLMLVGKWQRLSVRLETEDEDPNQGRLELKLKLPLR